MSKKIFSDTSIPWRSLSPTKILGLRAVTPPNVFTPDSQEHYLAQVRGNPQLERLADIIFADDTTFLAGLPTILDENQQVVIETLVQLAKKQGIR